MREKGPSDGADATAAGGRADDPPQVAVTRTAQPARQVGLARGGRPAAGDGRAATIGPARRSARRAQITDHAAEIFRHRGYAGTSVQQIADGVGLSKASLYYYVRSKDDLLFAVLEEVDLAAATILAEVSALPITPLERFAAYLRAWVAYNATHVAKIAVYNRDLDQLDQPRRRRLVASRDSRRAVVASLVRAAQEAGEVDTEVDAEAISQLVLGMTAQMHAWYRPRAGARPEPLGELAARMVAGGLSR